MEKTKCLLPSRTMTGMALGILVLALGCLNSQAYTNYAAGCNGCHGDFRGSTSTKGTVFPLNNNHEMHRADTSMDTACDLCHIGTSRKPVYIGISKGTTNNLGLGCSGCHVGAGLRAHHAANGVTECSECHPPDSVDPENVKPPYYGTLDTRVKNPGNTVLLANTNENWSIGDFLGVDNDGNNLYDLADYAVGPYQIVSVKPEGNNLRVTWQTAGGRTNRVQGARNINGTYSNLSSALAIPGVGLVTTNYLHLGGATNSIQFYRLKSEDH